MGRGGEAMWLGIGLCVWVRLGLRVWVLERLTAASVERLADPHHKVRIGIGEWGWRLGLGQVLQ